MQVHTQATSPIVTKPHVNNMLDELVQSVLTRGPCWRWYVGIMKVRDIGSDGDPAYEEWSVVFNDWIN